MNSRFYYAFDDTLPPRAMNFGSKASSDYPLMVNCAGYQTAEFPFNTDNPRGREDFYLMYMRSGTLDVNLDDRLQTVSSGDVVLFPPRYHYKYTYSGGEALAYYWVHFTGSYTERLLEECGLGSKPRIFTCDSDVKISVCFERIFDIFESDSKLLRQQLALALEGLILRTAENIDVNSAGRALDKSVKYIHSSYHKEIDIAELARMESLSYSGFIKLFKRRMGVPPSAYLINLRIRAACDLLTGTDMNVKQIGAAVGYNDAHFFSRLFKKHTGMSPMDYRVKG